MFLHDDDPMLRGWKNLDTRDFMTHSVWASCKQNIGNMATSVVLEINSTFHPHHLYSTETDTTIKQVGADNQYYM